MKKTFIGLVILSVCLLVFTWDRITSGPKLNADQTKNTDQQPEQQKQTDSTDSTTTEKKLVVSDEELAKLQSQGVVSSDVKYYIKNITGSFPKIVSLETGKEYTFKPGASYTKVTKLGWSGDGQTIAYIYQVPDPMYTNIEIFNTATIGDVVSQKFPNASRVLMTGEKSDYVWQDGNTVVHYGLRNFDQVKKFYRNASLDTYNIKTEKFDSIDANLTNLYSITFSVPKQEFLYVHAKLDPSTQATIGQEYVIESFDGTVLSTSETYDPNWNK